MTDLPYWTLHEAPPDSPKKWAVRVPTSSGRGKVVLFGARGYEDFTTHHDVERRERYRTRHQRDRLDDPYAPGFWSMWALWGESDDLDTAFAAAVRKAKKLMEKTMARKNPAKFTKKLSKIIDKLYEKGPQKLYNFDRKDIEDLLSMRDMIFVYDTVEGTFVDLTPGEIRAMDNRVKNLHLNLQKFQVESAPRQNPVHEQFSFSHYEEYANRLTDDQLHHAIIDALDALKVARTWEDNGAGEAKYLDQLSVLRREQKARGMRSNPMHFEQYEFRVSNSFLPALFNGDTSGLSPEDEAALDRFLAKATKMGRGHWAVIEEDAGFGRDEITGLGSDRALIAWMVSPARHNPRPLREDWLEKAREAGRVDAVNFGNTIAERRDYLAQTGWRSLDEDDRMALLRAWEQGVSEVRKNPEWARKVGGAVYRGTRKAAKYAKEVGTDLYHGAREAHRTHRSNPRLSTCAQQYLETALGSTDGEDRRPLDRQFSVSDFAPEAMQQAERDCLDFLSTNDVGDLDEGDVGHDFWLTRNRHGAGFWDRGLGALGDRLTKAAHAYGECDIYLGDDGKLHLS